MSETPPHTGEPRRKVVIRAPDQSAAVPGASVPGEPATTDPAGKPSITATGPTATGQPTPSPIVVRAPRRTANPEARRNLALFLAAGGGIAVVASMLLPWWTQSMGEVQLLDNAIMPLAAAPGIVAVVSSWVLLLSIAYENAKPGSSLVPTIGAASSLLIVLATAASLASPAAAVGAEASLTIHPAAGVYLAFVGGIVGLVGCGLLYLSRR